MSQSQKRQKTTTTAYSIPTEQFDPGAALDWNRIPYRIYHNSDLRLNMRKHLEQLLSDNPAAAQSVSEDTKAELRATRAKLKRHKIGDESSISTAASRLLSIVELLYKDLTGAEIESQTELPSECSTVTTNYVLLPRDSEEEEASLLWVNKAPRVFDLHIANLQKELGRGPIEYNLHQTTWENREAILAEVGYQILFCVGPLLSNVYRSRGIRRTLTKSPCGPSCIAEMTTSSSTSFTSRIWPRLIDLSSTAPIYIARPTSIFPSLALPCMRHSARTYPSPSFSNDYDSSPLLVSPRY
jgi:hypothetical protein